MVKEYIEYLKTTDWKVLRDIARGGWELYSPSLNKMVFVPEWEVYKLLQDEQARRILVEWQPK